jgi:hypothetical protein
MTWFLLALLGILLNSAGLCFFGESVIHRSMANGAAMAGVGDGIVALLLINAGIWVIAEAVALRRAGGGRE